MTCQIMRNHIKKTLPLHHRKVQQQPDENTNPSRNHSISIRVRPISSHLISYREPPLELYRIYWYWTTFHDVIPSHPITYQEDTNLESAHVEEQVGVVPWVHADERVIPLHSRDGTRQSILDVPEGSPPQVHVVLQSIIHPGNIET